MAMRKNWVPFLCTVIVFIAVHTIQSNQWRSLENPFSSNKSPEIKIGVVGSSNSGRGNNVITKASSLSTEKSVDRKKPKPSAAVADSGVRDFSYNHENWQRPPRIVILAGPHKTASTTLQTFLVNIAGRTISVEKEVRTSVNNNGLVTIDVFRPHPDVTDWVWPLGVPEEYEETLFRRSKNPAKFFAPLAAFCSGRRFRIFFGIERLQAHKMGDPNEDIAEYYRSLFRVPLSEGKNIVLGAEAMDSAMRDLARAKTMALSDEGESTHVAESSSQMIDILLNVFPWQHRNEHLGNTAKASASSSSSVSSPDKHALLPNLEDMEVHIHYRSPRIDHVISIWHQNTHGETLRHFVQEMGSQDPPILYQSNSLALALQFVRKGIKTTIVDMVGVSEHEASLVESDKLDSTGETIVGGIRGVVACDILRIGNGLCDDQSRMRLPGYKHPPQDQNIKDDKRVRNLTEEQLMEIDRVFNEYDCGVWQHLQKYQNRGLLRILYPSQNLFASCNPHGKNRDVSFRETLEKAAAIAMQDNGIPLVVRKKKKRNRNRAQSNH